MRVLDSYFRSLKLIALLRIELRFIIFNRFVVVKSNVEFSKIYSIVERSVSLNHSIHVRRGYATLTMILRAV